MAKKDKTTPEIKKEFPETIEHEMELSGTDLTHYGAELAKTLAEITTKKGDLKTITTKIKNDIQELTNKQEKLSLAINTGRETRQMACIVKFDDPQPMQKTYYYNGGVVKVEGMTPFDEEKIQNLFPPVVDEKKEDLPTDENLMLVDEALRTDEPAEDLAADENQ